MKRHAMDLSLFVTVILLLVIGVMMVFSSSFYVAMSQWQDKYYFFYKDLKFAIAGMIIMVVVAMVPYRIYRKFAPMLLVVSIVLLGLVLTPVGTTINGARRWIYIGSISIMPSEIAKISAIIFTAHSLTNNRHMIKKIHCWCIALFGYDWCLFWSDYSSAQFVDCYYNHTNYYDYGVCSRR